MARGAAGAAREALGIDAGDSGGGTARTTASGGGAPNTFVVPHELCRLTAALAEQQDALAVYVGMKALDDARALGRSRPDEADRLAVEEVRAISELLLTEAAIDKLGARWIAIEEIYQLVRNANVTVRNPRSDLPDRRRPCADARGRADERSHYLADRHGLGCDAARA